MGESDKRNDVPPSAGGAVYFIARALTGMRTTITDLGDDLIGVRPDLPGANTPYGLVTHCLGVLDYWAGHVVAGRPVRRDRAAEFLAHGTVSELLEHVDAAQVQLEADLDGFEPSSPPRNPPDRAFLGPDRDLDQGEVLLHVLEELDQHRGQLEIMRDVVGKRGETVRVAVRAPIEWLREKRGVKWRRPGPDQLPAWVADMDFPLQRRSARPSSTPWTAAISATRTGPIRTLWPRRSPNGCSDASAGAPTRSTYAG